MELSFLWSGGLAPLPFLCFFFLVGFVKLKELFLKNAYWDQFKERYKDELREVEIQEVEKIFSCHDPKNGYKTFKCPQCGFIKRICFSCKSRLCASCGKTHTDQWTRRLEKKLLKVTHRHLVFTISDKLWPLLEQNRSLYETLFQAVERTINRLVHDRYPTEQIKVGMICALHTGGKDLKFNPHVHVIVTEGGLNKSREWRDYTYFPYDKLRHLWKYELLTGLKQELNSLATPPPAAFFKVIDDLFENRALDFYVRAKDRLYHGKGLIKYIIRYIRHPPIAEYRIVRVEDGQVTFWYEQSDGEGGQKKRHYVTMTIDEFIRAILRHIPDRNFRMVRFYGIYSNRLRKIAKAALVLKDTLASFQEIGVQIAIIEHLEEEEEAKKKPVIPLLCPHCGTELELLEMYIPPTKPPPTPLIQRKLVQERSGQETLSLVEEIIFQNHRYYPKGIPLRIILADATANAIPEPVCKRSLDYLTQRGTIFRPQLDHYLPVT